MDLPEGDNAAVIKNVALSYLCVAFATCVVYDTIIKLREEFEILSPVFRWRLLLSSLNRRRAQQWSWAAFITRLVYIVAKYVGLTHQVYMATVLTGRNFPMDIKSCRDFAIFNGFIGTIVLGATQALMLLRIYRAIGPQNNGFMGILLSTAYVAQIIAVLIIQVLAITQDLKYLGMEHGTSICSAAMFPQWTYAIWIPVLCFEVILLYMAIGSVFDYRQNNRRLRASNVERYSPGISVSVILRDNVVSVSIMVAICLINLSGQHIFGSMVPVQTSFGLSTLGPIVLASQLLVNLHQSAMNDVEVSDAVGNEMDGVELATMRSSMPKLTFTSPDESDSDHVGPDSKWRTTSLYD